MEFKISRSQNDSKALRGHAGCVQEIVHQYAWLISGPNHELTPGPDTRSAPSFDASLESKIDFPEQCSICKCVRSKKWNQWHSNFQDRHTSILAFTLSVSQTGNKTIDACDLLYRSSSTRTSISFIHCSLAFYVHKGAWPPPPAERRMRSSSKRRPPTRWTSVSGPPLCTKSELQCRARRAEPRSKRLKLLHQQRNVAESWWIRADADQREDGPRSATS